jgi:hypothetical protein
MTLCTVRLFREPVTTECAPGHARDAHPFKCEWCATSYIFEYEARCTDPRDLAAIHEGARKAVLGEHTSGHNTDTVVIANTIPPWPEKDSLEITHKKECKERVEALNGGNPDGPYLLPDA